MAISNNIRPGRHFLQIPGPTNVPDRVLRAMDYPTIAVSYTHLTLPTNSGV